MDDRNSGDRLLHVTEIANRLADAFGSAPADMVLEALINVYLIVAKGNPCLAGKASNCALVVAQKLSEVEQRHLAGFPLH